MYVSVAMKLPADEMQVTQNRSRRNEAHSEASGSPNHAAISKEVQRAYVDNHASR